ncbi:hypothetical protein BCON_0034g00090 [Botryotinia convoluta]|uniref:Uncharacterized protein n=1 Tax=Botryotinia convoluta TaxID=54673 RepID=A0A4Z1IUV3_9HELO|nr:hypothetical protein BCON_0034g00090 [Botryotinia convoluta]
MNENNHIREFTMNNSGQGPLKTPGLGDISLFSELPKSSRFHQGSDDWEEGWVQKPRLTARELAMIGLTNLLTDMPNWHIGVFNDKDTAIWHEMAMKNKLISEKAWEWCLAELRDKARLFSTTNRVLALDAGACVSKSDTTVPKTLTRDLYTTIAELRRQFDKNDWQICRRDQQVVNLVDPSLYPLVYGKTKVLLEGGKVYLNGFSKSYGQGITTEIPRVHPKGSNVTGAASALKRLGVPFYNDEDLYRWSTNYQWLPCEIEFDGNSDTSVRIASYINNLHPIKNKPLYGMTEKLIELVIEPWNDCLLRGEHGRVPTRIRTYGTVDQEEELGESLASTERSHDNDPKHPEPGTAFTYEEWKEGRNGKSIVGQAVWEGLPEHAWRSEGVHEYIDTDHEFYSISLQESFREKGLQVFVQIGSIELGEWDKPFPGSDWDIDGTRSEHIAATSIYFYDVQNIENMQISFRQKTYMSESAYHRSDDNLFAKTFGIEEDGYYDDEGFHFAPATQDLGSIAVKQERLLSWSNALQYKLEPFTRSSLTESGHARFIKVMLVDPHYRICSTQNVPPQRHDWWANEVLGKEILGGKLPEELLNMIDKVVDEWPIGRDEAKRDRDNLLEEHRWAKEAEVRLTEACSSLSNFLPIQ